MGLKLPIKKLVEKQNDYGNEDVDPKSTTL